MFFLYFGIWNFLIFSQKKVFLVFREMKLFCPKINNFLIFSEKRFSYISGNRTFYPKELSKLEKKTLEKFFLYFGKWSFLATSLKSSYIFSKKCFYYISGRNLQSLKSKIFLYFSISGNSFFLEIG